MSLAEFYDSIDKLLNARLFTVGDAEITPFSLIYAVVILVLTGIASRLAQRAVVRIFSARSIKKEGTLLALKRLTHYIILLVGVAVALQTVGIKMQALFAAGAIFAVAIGFAMQNIVQNFVSGVILLVERTIHPGDVLEVDGKIVRVQDMGIRATVARTRDGEDLLVPNTLLVQSLVKNFTMKDSYIRLGADVGVVYGSDLKKVFEVLRHTAEQVPWRMLDRDPQVLLTDFGSSAVNFTVYVWIPDPWEGQRLSSELNERVWWALKEAGITIAFPQVDVHFDPLVNEAVKRLRD
ncbi:MAG: mechanosensitive ion channel [Candidatus Alcyoniella australis]|nr:mechanosensitive ion channel [Candidatus Alcyoniella australis]